MFHNFVIIIISIIIIIITCIIIIVILLLLLFVIVWEFFTPVLADDFSLEFEWQQVSSTLLSYSGWS